MASLLGLIIWAHSACHHVIIWWWSIKKSEDSTWAILLRQISYFFLQIVSYSQCPVQLFGNFIFPHFTPRSCWIHCTSWRWWFLGSKVFLFFQNHLVKSLLNSKTTVSAIFGSCNNTDLVLLRYWNNQPCRLVCTWHLTWECFLVV